MNNQASLQALTSHEFILTVLSGPEIGVSYRLLGQNVSLGRAADNDVVLQDQKSSRNHAVIERRNQDYWVIDLDSKLGTLVNGKKVNEAQLKVGDQINLGGTSLKFSSPQGMPSAAPPIHGLSLIHSTPPVPLVAPLPMNSMPSTKTGWPQGAAPSMPQSQGQPKSNLIPVVVALFVIIGGLMMFKNHADQKKATRIRDDAAFDEQLESSATANEKTEQEIMRKGKDTQQYAEAQAFYLRGFREFRENNYSRAIQNFQAALALYPSHPLAKRYLERSILKNDELITSALQRGEKYFQLQKYNNAFNEYRTVILLTADPRNRNNQLARKRIEAINLIMTNNK